MGKNFFIRSALMFVLISFAFVFSVNPVSGWYDREHKYVKMCMEECVKNAGSTYSHTSPAGKRCTKGHQLMEDGILFWLKAKAERKKGNIKAAGDYNAKAIHYIIVGGNVCPRTKAKTIKALGF